MSMTVPVAQMRIVRDINAAEQALDEALIRHSSLFTTMVSARREAGSAFHEKQHDRRDSREELIAAAGNQLDGLAFLASFR